MNHPSQFVSFYLAAVASADLAALDVYAEVLATLHDETLTWEHCANSSSEKGGPKCNRHAMHGHIFCEPCYLTCGGYSRHNPPRS